jgi:hypothetical protein
MGQVEREVNHEAWKGLMRTTLQCALAVCGTRGHELESLVAQINWGLETQRSRKLTLRSRGKTGGGTSG